MLGRCCIKTWSKTQGSIAQSSAESELLATVRGAAEGLGLISLSADMGLVFKVRLHIDAAAALGIIECPGVGRVRHLDAGTLWLQEQQLRNVIELRKVAGFENLSDLLTKHLTDEDQPLQRLDCIYLCERQVVTNVRVALCFGQLFSFCFC